MLLTLSQREELGTFFKSIRLAETGADRVKKIEQILAYLEIIQSYIRRLSHKRKLIFVDSGAGNCYLSYLVSYFYTHIDPRNVEIHCVDWNIRLMERNRVLASDLKLSGMHFHGRSIEDFTLDSSVDLVYSLHACDTATDMTLHLGLRLQARHILSVSCCQATLKKEFHAGELSGISRHRIFKDRLVYMIADSMRVLLMESLGYKADVIEFVSSRHTDKNVMLRASRGRIGNPEQSAMDYERIKQDFRMRPRLEDYLRPEVVDSSLAS